MEFQLTEKGTFEIIYDKWDMLVSLLGMGFSIALMVVVIVAAVRIGWRFWPWVLGVGFIAWLLMQPKLIDKLTVRSYTVINN